MVDNITVDNGTLTDYSVKSTEASGVHIQHIRPDLDAPYAQQVDDVGTYIYIGHAAPGTLGNAATWRIKRVVSATGTITWADGNGAFDNTWDNRTSLTYA